MAIRRARSTSSSTRATDHLVLSARVAGRGRLLRHVLLTGAVVTLVAGCSSSGSAATGAAPSARATSSATPTADTSLVKAPLAIYVVTSGDSGHTVSLPIGSDLTVNLSPPQLLSPGPSSGQQTVVLGTWSMLRSSDPSVLVPVPDPACPSQDDVIGLLRGYSISDAEAHRIAETAMCHPAEPITFAAFRALKGGVVTIEASGTCPGGSTCGRFTVTVRIG